MRQADGDDNLCESLRSALEALYRLLQGDLPDITLLSTHRKHEVATVFLDASYEPAEVFRLGRGVLAYIVSRFGASGVRVGCWAAVPLEVMELLNSVKARRTFICIPEEIALVAAYFQPELQELFEIPMLIISRITRLRTELLLKATLLHLIWVVWFMFSACVWRNCIHGSRLNTCRLE